MMMEENKNTEKKKEEKKQKPIRKLVFDESGVAISTAEDEKGTIKKGASYGHKISDRSKYFKSKPRATDYTSGENAYNLISDAEGASDKWVALDV